MITIEKLKLTPEAVRLIKRCNSVRAALMDAFDVSESTILRVATQNRANNFLTTLAVKNALVLFIKENEIDINKIYEKWK